MKKEYSTTDLNFATYLLFLGYNLLKVDNKETNEKRFVFELTEDEGNEKFHDFYAKDNPFKKFIDKRSILVNFIKRK